MPCRPTCPPTAPRFRLKGPFDGMPRAWQTLLDWCQGRKLKLAGINWEIDTPWEGVDPAKLETDLYAPARLVSEAGAGAAAAVEVAARVAGAAACSRRCWPAKSPRWAWSRTWRCRRPS
jgi:hypothetical protein